MKALSLLLLFSSTTAAQSSMSPRPITSPVRHAGTFHLATGTWTRSNASWLLGNDILYNNATPQSYYLSVSDNGVTPYQIVDSGRIPSLSDTGDGDAYLVDGLTFGYCSSAGVGAVLTISFLFDEANGPCSGPAVGSAGSFVLNGAPSSQTTGVLACWLLTVDLAASSSEFLLSGDADGLFDGSAALDNFGFGFTIAGHGNDPTGPFLAGDPANCPFGGGTSNFGYGGLCGTGLGQQDQFWIETQQLGGPGCYWFGGYPGNPWSGFYMRLHGDSTASGSPLAYCTPTSGNSVSASGAVLTSAGNFGQSLASFDLSGVPDQPGVLCAGPNPVNVPFGCGRRCIDGAMLRSSVMVPSGNQLSGALFDMSPPNAVNIQYFYRDPANLAGCGASWSLSNGLRP